MIYNPLSSSFGSLRTDSENDQFLLLHPDYFSTASINQKLAALQLVSDWETEYYGLSYNIPVLVENLDRNELAVYSDELPRLIPWNQLGFLFLRILPEYSRGSTSPAIPFNGNYLFFLSLLFNRSPSASCGSDGPVRIPDAGLP